MNNNKKIRSANLNKYYTNSNSYFASNMNN